MVVLKKQCRVSEESLLDARRPRNQAAVATALTLAFGIGKRIVDPMTTLAALASDIGEESGTVAVPRAGVREVDAVALALGQADVAVRERHLAVQREKDAVEAADRAKDEFIATLSHELRNPLAALTSAADILRRNDLNSNAGRDARQVIERQIGHMSRMIEDLLDLSRVIAGKTHLKLERFDLAALASDVVASWRMEGRTARHVFTVDAVPAFGKGATFNVRLPRVEAGVEEEPAPPSENVLPSKPKRVLVIDDNDYARQSLAALLSFEGHETYEAANGARGAELAEQVRPRIALIDIGLPDISGYEVARRIRAALNGDIVLFAVTGYGQPEDQRRALEAGFDAHL